MGSVESVKSVSEIFSPVSGSVSEVNEKLSDNPALINKDCYGDGERSATVLTTFVQRSWLFGFRLAVQTETEIFRRA